MGRYAEDTNVSIEKSMMEIRQTVVTRYGATGFLLIEDADRNGVGFIYKGRNVRILMKMPGRDEKRFGLTETGRERTSDAQITAEWQKECRRIWRALALAVKAKLELVENGAPFDAEFMPYLVMANNRTVADYALPEITKMIESGKVPALLSDFKREKESE